MSNDRLLQNVVSILLMTGYNVSERCEIRPRSFDLMTSKGENLLVIKVVSQIDSVNEDIAWDLDKIARHLHAVPLIIGERARDVALERGAIYLRYGINAVSSATLYDFLAEGELPLVYASPGGLYVNIDAERLRTLREEQAMSLGDLAHALGVSRRTISKYEGGMGTTLEMAMRLEEFFNDDIVKPIDLFHYTPVEEERVPASLPSGHHVEGEESLKKPEDHLRSIGINVHELRRSPFHAFAVFENETILTCYGTPQKTVQRAELVGNISQITGTHSLCVVSDYRKEKMIGKTLVIGEERLKDVEDAEDLMEMVSDEK
ncbi:MAG: transcriptional regulator [Methanocorpusculum sp.]|jgi:putative transcriptional regulator|nr:transcriptional regulator [Methanocorpusculum sp.]MDD3257321.1 transcriptional regulator [Methanocorpusculum sp.]